MEIYSILKTHRASGRPTGETIFAGTEEEVKNYMEDNADSFDRFQDEFVVKKGTLEENTYVDDKNFLQWK